MTAADRTTQKYTIIVTEAFSDEKNITLFKILGLDAEINDTEISLTVPYGIDITSLTPTINVTGVSVNPASDVAQDFTYPVTYTVTAEDSSTKNYVVTITGGCRRIYNDTQIDTLITDGYIPVANADELNALRNAASTTMGAGTIWEGTYTTGLDKKYVQVRNIDLSGYSSGTGWVPISTFIGTYDGNELCIDRLKINNSVGTNSGLFGLTASGCDLKNMRIINADIYAGSVAGTVARSFVDSTATNCIVIDSKVSAKTAVGGMFGMILADTNVSNCHVINTEVILRDSTDTVVYLGGFTGVVGKSTEDIKAAIVEDCSVRGGTVSMVHNTRANRRTGGFVGSAYRDAIIRNSFSTVAVIGSGSNLGPTHGVGGFIGHNGVTITPNSQIINCYSTGSVSRTSGSNVALGGFCGGNTATITNSYYDRETSGQTDTEKGIPRYTYQMQQGYANSTIGGETMYTDWSDDAWRFNPIDEYPELQIFVPIP